MCHPLIQLEQILSETQFVHSCEQTGGTTGSWTHTSFSICHPLIQAEQILSETQFVHSFEQTGGTTGS